MRDHLLPSSQFAFCNVLVLAAPVDLVQARSPDSLFGEIKQLRADLEEQYRRHKKELEDQNQRHKKELEDQNQRHDILKAEILKQMLRIDALEAALAKSAAAK